MKGGLNHSTYGSGLWHTSSKPYIMTQKSVNARARATAGSVHDSKERRMYVPRVQKDNHYRILCDPNELN
jgi:hypothetical protein